MKKIYKHYKGELYELISEALCSETLQSLIVYKSIKTGKVWVRPKSMFFETILIEGENKLRFEEIHTGAISD